MAPSNKPTSKPAWCLTARVADAHLHPVPCGTLELVFAYPGGTRRGSSIVVTARMATRSAAAPPAHGPATAP